MRKGLNFDWPVYAIKIGIFMLTGHMAFSQTPRIYTLQECIDIALKKSIAVKQLKQGLIQSDMSL